MNWLAFPRSLVNVRSSILNFYMLTLKTVHRSPRSRGKPSSLIERDLIRERTGAGRETAKKPGVRFGRPRKLTWDQSELARRLISEGKSVREIAAVFNVHSATIYRLAAI
jgi:DNA-binding NarL/FixJ family response regulator